MNGNRRISFAICLVVIALAGGALRLESSRELRAAQQDQPEQSQPAQQPQPSQTDKAPANQEQQPKKKKKSSFFSGLKAVTGESSEQTQATATAGTKGVGEGEKISNMTPSAADRQQVVDMENYSVAQKDLKKFQDDGRLQPKK